MAIMDMGYRLARVGTLHKRVHRARTKLIDSTRHLIVLLTEHPEAYQDSIERLCYLVDFLISEDESETTKWIWNLQYWDSSMYESHRKKHYQHVIQIEVTQKSDIKSEYFYLWQKDRARYLEIWDQFWHKVSMMYKSCSEVTDEAENAPPTPKSANKKRRHLRWSEYDDWLLRRKFRGAAFSNNEDVLYDDVQIPPLYCTDADVYAVLEMLQEPKPVPLDQVFFSAVAPKHFPRGETTEVTVVMYEEEYRSILEQIKEYYDNEVKVRESGALEVEKHAKIRIIMQSEDPGVHFHDAVQEGIWIGKYLQFLFWVEIPQDYDKNQIHLSAHVYVNDVRLTTLRFLAKCVSDSVQQITPQRKDIRTAFLSYAREDIDEVTVVAQGIQKVRPDLELFFDLEDLRSGDHWQEVLKSEIDQRDMLYLCWSGNAKHSPWVDFEWRYMYSQRGINCIDPIPLESPTACPPPQELEQLHFDDRWLHYRTKKPPHIASPRTTRFYIRDCRNGNIFPINKKIVLIGRAPDTDIHLSSRQVSRCHAKIEAMSDGRFWVRDMNSMNGTFHAETEERITVAGCIVTRGAKIRLASETLEIL